MSRIYIICPKVEPIIENTIDGDVLLKSYIDTDDV